MRLRNFLFAGCFLVATQSFAGDSGTREPRSSKSLDFSGEIVEGANRQSMDSLVSFSQRTDSKEKPYLYHKRDNFQDEHENSMRTLLLSF